MKQIEVYVTINLHVYIKLLKEFTYQRMSFPNRYAFPAVNMYLLFKYDERVLYHGRKMIVLRTRKLR